MALVPSFLPGALPPSSPSGKCSLHRGLGAHPAYALGGAAREHAEPMHSPEREKGTRCSEQKGSTSQSSSPTQLLAAPGLAFSEGSGHTLA